MSKWPTSPLGELCGLINGRAFKPSDWGKSGLPIVRIQNLNDPTKPFNYYNGDYKEKHRIDNGDILLSWSGTPGTSFGCFRWMRGPALLNQHIFKVIVDDDIIDGEFFIYAVNSKLDEMIRQAHGGVGLRHITKKKLEAIHLPTPPLAEQRRIVARIKECMERVEEIEENSQLINFEIEALLPSMLHQRFEELRSRVDIEKLEDVTEIKGGGSLPKGGGEDLGKDCVLLVKVGDMNAPGNERIIQVSRAYLPASKALKKIIAPGAVIFPKRGGAIATNKKRMLGRPAMIDPNLMAVVAKPERIRAEYLYYWTQTFDLTDISNGGVIPQLNRKNLTPLEIPVPGLDEQESIISELEQAEASCFELRATFEEAHQERYSLRESILRKAFTGEL